MTIPYDLAHPADGAAPALLVLLWLACVLTACFVHGLHHARAAHRARFAWRLHDAPFSALVEHAADMVTVLDEDGVIRYQSPSIEAVLGYRPDQVRDSTLWFLVYPADVGLLQQCLAAGQAGGRGAVEFRARRRDGELRYLEATFSDLSADPGVRGIVLYTRDVTERKRFELQLARQAFYDPLTDLPNRALLMDRLCHLVAGAERRGSRPAVLFLDLDGFKAVNDRLGHAAGDELLAMVARRIQGTIRPDDTAARFGGDEFAVLLAGAIRPIVALRAAHRIIEQVSAPFTIRGEPVRISASVGIAFSHAEGEPVAAEDLVRRADVALYRAKAAGKARAVVFEAGMDQITPAATPAPATPPLATPSRPAEPASRPASAGGA